MLDRKNSSAIRGEAEGGLWTENERETETERREGKMKGERVMES